MENTGVKKLTISSIFSWFFGIIFAFMILGSLVNKSWISAVIALLATVFILPPANKILRSKMQFECSKGVKFLIGLAAFIAIGYFSSADSVNVSNDLPTTEKQNTTSVESAIKVSAVTLSEEYDANKILADQKYKGNLVEITGVINNIGKDILDTPYVSFNGKQYSLFGVQCMFSKKLEGKLANLSKGQTITVRGKVSGELIGNVVVRDCSF